MMKKAKLVLLLLVAAVLLLSGCIYTHQPGTAVAPPEPTETPGYDLPMALPEELDPEDLEGWDDEDFILDAVVVDGISIPSASVVIIGDDEIFPTHVSLMPLDGILMMDVFWNMQTGEVSLMGLNGFVSFELDSATFQVDGQTITLEQEALRIGDEIYVPFQFFRDVFGAGAAYFSGGHVFIQTGESDMQ